MGGGTEVLQNLNPKLFVKRDDRVATEDDWNENITDEFDAREVFGELSYLYRVNISANKFKFKKILYFNKSLLKSCQTAPKVHDVCRGSKKERCIHFNF